MRKMSYNKRKIISDTSEGDAEIAPRITWGQLVVIRRMNKKLDLVKDVFTVGRENCDLNLSTDEMSLAHLQFISRIHFRLRRNISPDDPVFLQDLSRNGTFVNGERVGLGNSRILQDKDEIAIGSEIRKVFVFYDRYSSKYFNMPDLIKNDYYISRQLGFGACGVVRLVFNKRTCAKYAMKQIDKKKTDDGKQKLNDPSRIMNEANIMKKLHHPFIVNIYDIVDTPTAVFLILELMEGGDLYTKITQEGHLEESIAKDIFYQLAVAVHHLHSKNITHRDLKPENILLQNHDEKTVVKLSDFGLSKIVDDSTFLRTECGTAMYVAPEILRKDIITYTEKVDVWSMGVILYVCLSGCVPFTDKCSLKEQICKGKYSFKQRIWNLVSEECKDLIMKMLTVDPKERPSSSEVVEHIWLQELNVKKEYAELLNQTHSFQKLDLTATDLEESLDVNFNTFTETDTHDIEPPVKKHCSEIIL